MQFGETLRKAREAKGLTHSQVAEETHMLVQIVQDMENEDFHRIAAAIYGRGFVRLFAECVGLDPRPLVAEFSELYENRGDASRKASPPPPPPESGAFDFGADAQPPQPDGAPPGTVQDDLAPQPPEGTRGLDLFDPGARAPESPAPDAPAPQRDASRFAPPESSYSDPGESRFADAMASVAKRFREGISAVSGGVSRVPRRVWRTGALVLAAVVCLFLLVRGCRSFVSSMSEEKGNAAEAEQAAPAQDRNGAGGKRAADRPPAPKRRFSKLPGDLYID